LITPPLAFTVLPWLLLGGILLMASMLRRFFGQKGEIQLLTAEQYPLFEPSAVALVPQALLNINAPHDLDKTRHLRRGEPDRVDPHLIVAVGSPGRWLLTELKRRLIERYGTLPEKVALLWVDMAALGHTPAAPTHIEIDLDPAREIALLQPDWKEVSSNLRRGIGTVPWWDNRSVDESARARARLALSTEIGKGTLRTVPIALTLSAQKRRIGPGYTSVMVAFGGDEASSGMLYDIFNLTKFVEQSIEPSQRLLLLCTGDIVAASTPQRQQEQEKWTAAALYEYEHLQQNDATWDSVIQPVTGSPFDIAYLFSNTIAKTEDTNVDKQYGKDITLSNRDAASGSLGVVLEWLETLLDPASTKTLREQIRAEVTSTPSLMSELHLPLAGSIGAATVQIPVDILTQWAEALFVHEIVTHCQTNTSPTPATREEVSSFLRGIEEGSTIHHPFWQDIAEWEQFRDRQPFAPHFFYEVTRKAGYSLSHKIAAFITETLQNSISAPGHAFQVLLSLLLGLEGRLGEIIRGEKPDSDPDRREVVRWLQLQGQQVTAWKQHITHWIETFNHLAQQSLIERQRTEQTWNRFLETRTGKTSAIAIRLPDIKHRIESQITAQAQQYLLNRQGWLWAATPPNGRLLLPALPEEGITLKQLNSEQVAQRIGFSSEQHAEIRQRLYEWAHYVAAFIKHGTDYHLERHLTNPQRDLAESLATESNYLLPFNRGNADALLNPDKSTGRSAVPMRTYVGPRAITQQIASTIADLTRASQSTTDDPFTLNVALTVSQIPVETIEFYQQSIKKNLTHERDQVFIAEQRARFWLKQLQKTIKDDALAILYTEQGDLRSDLPVGLVTIQPEVFAAVMGKVPIQTTLPSFAAFRYEFRKWLSEAHALEWCARALLLNILKLEYGTLTFVDKETSHPIAVTTQWYNAIPLYLSWVKNNPAALRQLQSTVEDAKLNAGFELQQLLRSTLLRDDVYTLSQSTLPLHQDLWYFLLAVGGYELTR
jgi:hypothetical protein